MEEESDDVVALAFHFYQQRDVAAARELIQRVRVDEDIEWSVLDDFVHARTCWNSKEHARHAILVMEWLVLECDLNVNDCEPLIEALSLRRYEAVHFLLHHGARPRERYFQLMRGACDANEANMAWAFLEYGASMKGDYFVQDYVHVMHRQRLNARRVAVVAYGAIRLTYGRDVAELVARRVWRTRNDIKWQPSLLPKPSSKHVFYVTVAVCVAIVTVCYQLVVK